MESTTVSNSEIVTVDRGVVILFDALGTKGILAHQTLFEAVNGWQGILKVVNEAASKIEELDACKACEVVQFSDTVYVLLVPNEDDDLYPLLASATKMLERLMYVAMIEHRVFLRGAVSVGRYYFFEQKVLGTAIDEVASWYEEANWIGFVATPSLGRFLRFLEYQGAPLDGWINQKEVPSSKGNKPRSLWALNWPAYGHGNFPRFYESILISFAWHAGALSPAVAEKYDETLRFVESIIMPR